MQGCQGAVSGEWGHGCCCRGRLGPAVIPLVVRPLSHGALHTTCIVEALGRPSRAGARTGGVQRLGGAWVVCTPAVVADEAALAFREVPR